MNDWMVAINNDGRVIDVLPWCPVRALLPRVPCQIPDSWDEYFVLIIKATSRENAIVDATDRFLANRRRGVW